MSNTPVTNDDLDARRAGRRKIIHVDMDAFFASVEQRDDPSLRGRPVAVGGAEKRGVVAAASYEARRFGVRSAMPGYRAAQMCPGLVFVPPRFDVYRQVSGQIREIFLEFTTLVEPVSLDEAYLDVTENIKGVEYASAIAAAIRARIFAATGLTASAGVSYNKFLAKMASGRNKPNGMCVIPPEKGAAFVAEMPVARFHGVGPATAAKFAELGIETGADLLKLDVAFLTSHFGKAGAHFYAIARGEDDRPVVADRERKSIGAETTFESDMHVYEDVVFQLRPLCVTVFERCRAHCLTGRRVTVKIRHSDFSLASRCVTLDAPVESPESLFRIASVLLRQLDASVGVRLVGVAISCFDNGISVQQSFDFDR